MPRRKYLNDCFIVLGAMILGHTSVCVAQQPVESPSAEACFGGFVDAIVHPPRDEVPASFHLDRMRREAQVRAAPATFEPLVREALRLPPPKDVAVSEKRRAREGDEPEEFRRRTAKAMAAAQVLPLLGRKICDSLLTEFFPVHVELARAAEQDVVAKAAISETDRRISAGRAAWYASRCADLIGAATAAQSEVLLEPVFALIAGGKQLPWINLRAMTYLESFPQKRPEHVKRLKAILTSDRDLGSDRRHNIEKAIARMEQAEAEAHPGKSEVGGDMPSPGPAPVKSDPK